MFHINYHRSKKMGFYMLCQLQVAIRYQYMTIESVYICIDSNRNILVENRSIKTDHKNSTKTLKI